MEKKIFSWRTGGKGCRRTGVATVLLKRSSGCESALLKKNSGKEVIFLKKLLGEHAFR
ncbi:hypothetical protein XOC_3243 [Xanthomonas oryzae pv. oryzicola BLS256]|uniref:Uncharacterized protein n=1 Tax=Xanthomonas oryzae pv. oryzicola (strain BLS256) TaxID=383407 RepID=G7TB37_XANOB|nr:hypothetical protein [Xanthomonas oryzae]AEQ97338.1 hypothetical protein XOC_3243 [Xanthomonas oryzae pv. oryzicola BLS256]